MPIISTGLMIFAKGIASDLSSQLTSTGRAADNVPPPWARVDSESRDEFYASLGR